MENDSEEATTSSLPFLIDVSEDDSCTTETVSPSTTPDNKTHMRRRVVDPRLCQQFTRDGFVRIDQPMLTPAYVQALHQRLEEILRGRYSTGVAPKKAPRRLKSEYQGSPFLRKKEETAAQLLLLSIEQRKAYCKPKPQAIVGPLGYQGQKTKVLQVINAFQADTLFRRVALHPRLGHAIAHIAGGPFVQHGVRLASDQIWAKPPQAGPLAWHCDGPYFMFDPPDVVTVWVALDTMDDEAMGPLRYIKGSHEWKNDQVGAYTGFLGDNNWPGGGGMEEEIVSMLGLPAGALSIHHGQTWHGSLANTSAKPRRGFGIHYVPAHVKFTKEAAFSKLWRPYVEEVIAAGGDPGSVSLPETDFPVVWSPETEA